MLLVWWISSIFKRIQVNNRFFHKEINFHQSKIHRTLVLVLLSHWHMQRNYLNLKVSKNSSEIVNVSLISGQKAPRKIGKKWILNLPNFLFVNYICTADGEIISLLKISPFCTLMVSHGAHEDFCINDGGNLPWLSSCLSVFTKYWFCEPGM